MSDVQRRAPLQGAVEVAGANLLAPGERAGDADRDRVIHWLAKTHADGFIGAEEYDIRANAALAADTRTKLRQLTLDLPPVPAPRNLKLDVDHTIAIRMKFLASTFGFLGFGVAAPVFIHALIGYPLPVWAVLLMVITIVAGSAGAVASLVAWFSWEDKKDG